MTAIGEPFRSSRMFAAEAVRPAAPTPEPLTARARRALSDDALGERREQELRYVGGLYIPSPSQVSCERLVLQYAAAARRALPGAGDSLYVLGPPGTGKTTAVRAAAARYHRRRLTEVGMCGVQDPTWVREGCVADLVPAIMTTVHGDAKQKAFVAQIVDYLGYPTNDGAARLADRIPVLALRHGVGLVIADDVRNLADLGRSRDAIHNTIKNINTELGFLNVCSVYIGNPDESGFGNLFANPQLEQRLIPTWIKDMNFDLRSFEDTTDNIVWLDYLHDWEVALSVVLPHMEEDDLSSRLGRRLWNRTKGSVGGLSGLLKRAVADVLGENDPRARLTLTADRVDQTPMPERFSRDTP